MALLWWQGLVWGSGGYFLEADTLMGGPDSILEAPVSPVQVPLEGPAKQPKWRHEQSTTLHRGLCTHRPLSSVPNPARPREAVTSVSPGTSCRLSRVPFPTRVTTAFPSFSSTCCDKGPYAGGGEDHGMVAEFSQPRSQPAPSLRLEGTQSRLLRPRAAPPSQGPPSGRRATREPRSWRFKCSRAVYTSKRTGFAE